MDTGLIRPYSVIQWRCQWSAFRGWPSHSMCSRPHFTGKPDWPRADFAENCLLRAGSKASAVSRFREKLSPANGVQGITAISRKIALLCVMSAKLAKWVAKKWGPTCDRDISDSAIYTTAIYRAYTVSWLLMPWLLVLPGHQQPWCWQHKMGKFFSSFREFQHFCNTSVSSNDT